MALLKTFLLFRQIRSKKKGQEAKRNKGVIRIPAQNKNSLLFPFTK
ncbi:hypothetical protein [endosymbiont GvMRE of Glomus versiforme]|nr:hypothetical protein [endosymbiont GvMRE of Glomus versiforme]